MRLRFDSDEEQFIRPYTVLINNRRFKKDIRQPIKLIEGKHEVIIKNSEGEEIKRSVKVKKGKPSQIRVKI